MTLPGTLITTRESPPARSAPSDVSVWHIVGFTERGPATPSLVHNMAEYASVFGDRVSYGLLYDSLDTFFHEGGGSAYVQRVLGDSAAKASHVLQNGSSADVLKVSAKEYGDYGNSYKVQVAAGGAGGTFVLKILDSGDVVLETSPDLADQAEAVAWSAISQIVDVTQEAGTGDPAVAAAAALTGGTDDHASADDDNWLAALNLLSADLGPGQVSAPGRTTDTAHSQLLSHADAHNRVALLDAPDTATVGTLTASAAAQTALASRRGGLFAPWVTIPGLVPSTVRTVPYSAVQAGLIARLDGQGQSPNVPAAGAAAPCQYALGVTQSWSDDDFNTLSAAGVNVAKIVYGGVRTYGFRSLADPDSDPNWVQLNSARLFMDIMGKGDIIAERYVFSELDGKGHKVAQYNGELKGMLAPYFDAGSLFGERPEEAFSVDTGPAVNTVASLAAGELRAIISLRTSPFAELVVLEIVKVATSEVLA